MRNRNWHKYFPELGNCNCTFWRGAKEAPEKEGAVKGGTEGGDRFRTALVLLNWELAEEAAPVPSRPRAPEPAPTPALKKSRVGEGGALESLLWVSVWETK